MGKEIGLIIPAYNAHNTIKKLLHSICLFNFLEKVDVLLVDDASDNNYNYLKDLFPEISLEILTLEKNHGPGYARNIGIKWAIEKKIPYIMFSDADDYFININFWSEITEEEKINNDLFIFNFLDEGIKANIRDIDVWCFAKIYKTEIIEKNSIYFSENYSNEDVIFNFIYFSMVKNAYMSSSPIYFWHFRENSLSRTDNYIYDSVAGLAYNLTKAFLKHKNDIPETKKISMIINRMIRLYYHVNELLNYYPNMLQGPNQDEKILKSLKYFYDNCYKPLQDKITINQIFQEFDEINSGNDILHHFVWIDYFTFLRIIDEY